MIYAGIFLLALFFTLFSKTNELLNSFTGRIYFSVFNLLVSNILGSLQGQILFSVFQIIRLDLSLDTYSRLSLITGYLTMSISTGFIVLCFFRLEKIFSHKERQKSGRLEEVFNNSEDRTQLQYKWLSKKYEFMFGDFKNRSAHQFFFAYWIIAFDPVYILLIFSLQSIPVVECLSIVILVLAYIIFSGVIKPFKKKTIAFLYFFNFSCVLVAGILNLILAIIDSLNLNFSGVEIQGWLVVSIIFLNAGLNTLFSLGGLLFEIFHKLKKKDKEEEDRASTVKKAAIETVPQKITPRSHAPLSALQRPFPSDSGVLNGADSQSNLSISEPTSSLQIIKGERRPKRVVLKVRRTPEI